MSTSRRVFLGSSLALGLALTAGVAHARRPAPRKHLRILILGGTGFLGPALVEAAKARGHSLTLFNRGKTEKRIGVIEDVEKFFGNRDPNLRADDADPASPQGLSQIAAAVQKGDQWDAVIDTSGYFPRMVTAAAEALKDAAGCYVFISTVSVYAGNDAPGADESATLGVVPDDHPENFGPQMEYYGPYKARCEREVSRIFGTRALNIRPGFIVGPGDPTDRFTYWPVRYSQGGEMLAPGAPDDAVQFIDVRDLAEWTIHCVEQGTRGTFNALGPERPDTMGNLLAACRAAAPKADTKLTWVSTDFIESQGLAPGGDLPIWLPSAGEAAGFHRRSNAAAVKAGLKFRTTEAICADTLAWWPKEIARRERVGKELVEQAKAAGKTPPNLPDPKSLRAGLPRERESQVLAAWSTRTTKPGAIESPAPAAAPKN